jgi:hypothetical protein
MIAMKIPLTMKMPLAIKILLTMRVPLNCPAAEGPAEGDS